MKRRTLTMVVGLLLCLSLIGVGFAAWVISVGDEAELSGNIQVETVTDKRLVVNVTKNDQSIVFGAPETMNDADAWLTASGTGVGTENLVATFTITVAYVSGGAISKSDLNDIVTTLDVTSESYTNPTEGQPAYNAIKKAIDDGYVAANPTIEVSDDKDTNANLVTLDITIKFNWGTAFGGNNPYVYYNNLDPKNTEDGQSKTNAELALDALAAFADLTGSVYKITVEVKPKTAA